MKQLMLTAVAGAALSATCAPASAIFEVFFGEDLGNGEVDNNTVPLVAPFPNSDAAQAEFLSNLQNPITESFEGFTPEAIDPVFPTTINENPPTGIDFGPSGMADFDRGAVVRGVDNEGRYASDGVQFLFLPQGQDATTIMFTEPQVALGFRAIDVGDYSGQLTTMTLISMNGSRRIIEVPHSVAEGGANSGSVLYLGIIDTDEPFIGLELTNSASGVDGFAFDEFTIGNFIIPPPPPPPPSTRTVPVGTPLTATLLLLGAGGVAGTVARRRK